jgi:8-oxo-dGTP pyrophosphatase MutT (NUDIX family)
LHVDAGRSMRAGIRARGEQGMAAHQDRESASSRLVSRTLHLYWRFARGLTLGVRAAVLDGADRVFLIRHTYVPGWHLPGGGVEAGETTLAALKRELVEEACIELAAEPPLHGIYFNAKASRRDHVLLYVVRDFHLVGTKTPDREIAEAGFFPLEFLPEGTTPATRRRLDEITSGAAASPTW